MLYYFKRMNLVVYAVLAGIIPSLIWLFFWTREDITHPESRFILTLSFFGGMLSVALAIVAEKYAGNVFTDPTIRYTLWAAIEEIVKFLAVLSVALFTKQNDEPIDAMIYCITVALGFAALENTLFILGPLSNGEIIKSVVTGNMRFMGATLVHVVSSAVVGFALGLAFYRGYFLKIVAGIIGLGVAITFHTAFNLSIIATGTLDSLKVFSWVWGAVVILIILFEEIKVVHPQTVKPNELV